MDNYIEKISLKKIYILYFVLASMFILIAVEYSPTLFYKCIYIVLISIIFAGMAFDSANVLITYRIIYVAWKRWLSFKNIEIAVILLILISLLVNIVGSIQVINTISYIDILSILISLLAMYMAFKKYNILIMPATIEILEKKIGDEYLIKHLIEKKIGDEYLFISTVRALQFSTNKFT